MAKNTTVAEQPEKAPPFTPAERKMMVGNRAPEAARYHEMVDREHRGKLDSAVNPVKMEIADRAAVTREIKEYALRIGAGLAGVTEVSPAYVYKDEHVAERYAISLAMEMDYDRIATAPGLPAESEATRIYYDLGEVVIKLARHIRGLGYPATAQHPLISRHILQPPLAVASGLAGLGRNGLAISRQFGPRMRLGSVTTDLPLLPDQPANLGVSEFCKRCHVCEKACPSGAIAAETALVRGVEKFVIDGARCRSYICANHGCGVCIKVCVLNKLARQGKWIKTIE